MTSTSPNRKYALRLLAGVVIVLSVSFFLNTWVNPLWVSPSPWSDNEFADYKPIHKHPRTGKAGLAMRGGWDAAIVGSSRLDIALDPQHPLWEGRKVVNLSLRGGNLCEFAPMVELAIEHNDLELLILGVDHYDLTSQVQIANMAAFAQSPLSDKDTQLEQNIRNHIGGSTLEMSIKAINYRARGRLASYDQFGQWSHSLDGRPFRSIYLTDSLPQAILWTQRRREHPQAAPAKITALDSIIEACRSRDIPMVILIPPNHACYIATFYIADAIDPSFDATRHIITERIRRSDRIHPDAEPIPVWDFHDFHPWNSEQLPPAGSTEKMQRWIDGTHATPEIGAFMLNCALNGRALIPPGTATAYGTELTSLPDPSRAGDLRRGYEDFTRREDFGWAREVYLEATDGGQVTSNDPTEEH